MAGDEQGEQKAGATQGESGKDAEGSKASTEDSELSKAEGKFMTNLKTLLSPRHRAPKSDPAAPPDAEPSPRRVTLVSDKSVPEPPEEDAPAPPPPAATTKPPASSSPMGLLRSISRRLTWRDSKASGLPSPLTSPQPHASRAPSNPQAAGSAEGSSPASDEAAKSGEGKPEGNPEGKLEEGKLAGRKKPSKTDMRRHKTAATLVKDVKDEVAADTSSKHRMSRNKSANHLVADVRGDVAALADSNPRREKGEKAATRHRSASAYADSRKDDLEAPHTRSQKRESTRTHHHHHKKRHHHKTSKATEVAVGDNAAAAAEAPEKAGGDSEEVQARANSGGESEEAEARETATRPDRAHTTLALTLPNSAPTFVLTPSEPTTPVRKPEAVQLPPAKASPEKLNLSQQLLTKRAHRRSRSLSGIPELDKLQAGGALDGVSDGASEGVAATPSASPLRGSRHRRNFSLSIKEFQPSLTPLIESASKHLSGNRLSGNRTTSFYNLVKTFLTDQPEDLISAADDPDAAPAELDLDDTRCTDTGGPSTHLSTRPGSLRILMMEGRGLAVRDMNGLSDPYVVLKLKYPGRPSLKRRTAIMYKTLNPVWHEEHVFDVTQSNGLLQMQVWDNDTFSGDDAMGDFTVPLADILPYCGEPRWITLANVECGEVRVQLSYTPPFAGQVLQAAKANQTKIVQSLLQAGADPNEEQDGVRPIFFAIRHRNAEMVRVLVASSPAAAPLLLHGPCHEKSGGTPVHCAVATRDINLLMALLDAGSGSLDINAKDKHDNTPLYYAANSKSDQTTLIKMLLDAGANVLEKCGDHPVYELPDIHPANLDLLARIAVAPTCQSHGAWSHGKNRINMYIDQTEFLPGSTVVGIINLFLGEPTVVTSLAVTIEGMDCSYWVSGVDIIKRKKRFFRMSQSVTKQAEGERPDLVPVVTPRGKNICSQKSRAIYKSVVDLHATVSEAGSNAGSDTSDSKSDINGELFGGLADGATCEGDATAASSIDTDILVNRSRRCRGAVDGPLMGVHSFPFSIRLPCGLHGSFLKGTTAEFKRGVSYRIVAALNKGELEIERPLKINHVYNYDPVRNSEPVTVTAKDGDIELAATIPSTHVVIGERVPLTVVYSNPNTSKPIQAVKVHVYEKTVQRAKVMGIQKEKESTYEVWSKVFPETQCKKLLSSKTITVPMDRTWQSVETPNKLLTISHTLVVYLDIPYYKDVLLSIPITVLPPEGVHMGTYLQQIEQKPCKMNELLVSMPLLKQNSAPGLPRLNASSPSPSPSPDVFPRTERMMSNPTLEREGVKSTRGSGSMVVTRDPLRDKAMKSSGSGSVVVTRDKAKHAKSSPLGNMDPGTSQLSASAPAKAKAKHQKTSPCDPTRSSQGSSPNKSKDTEAHPAKHEKKSPRTASKPAESSPSPPPGASSSKDPSSPRAAQCE